MRLISCLLPHTGHMNIYICQIVRVGVICKLLGVALRNYGTVTVSRVVCQKLVVCQKIDSVW